MTSPQVWSGHFAGVEPPSRAALPLSLLTNSFVTGDQACTHKGSQISTGAQKHGEKSALWRCDGFTKQNHIVDLDVSRPAKLRSTELVFKFSVRRFWSERLTGVHRR